MALILSCASWATNAARAATPLEAHGALALVVHRSNPLDRISPEELQEILLGETPSWPDGRMLVLVQRDPRSPVFRTVLDRMLQMSRTEYARHLLRLEYQGRRAMRVKVLNSSAAACNFIFNVPARSGLSRRLRLQTS